MEDRCEIWKVRERKPRKDERYMQNLEGEVERAKERWKIYAKSGRRGRESQGKMEDICEIWKVRERKPRKDGRYMRNLEGERYLCLTLGQTGW